MWPARVLEWCEPPLGGVAWQASASLTLWEKAGAPGVEGGHFKGRSSLAGSGISFKPYSSDSRQYADCLVKDYGSSLDKQCGK